MDMDLNQMETFLSSQMKKREGGISETQANCFAHFWKSNKSRIHESLLKTTRWDSKLKTTNWRLDMQNNDNGEITPAIVFNMKISNAEDVSSL